MNISIKQIILWVFFWPFLLPYTLFKKYVFKRKYSKTLSAISALAIILIFYNITNQNNEPSIHYVTKKVGTDKLTAAKEKQSILAEEKANKEADYSSLSSKYSSYQESEANKKSSIAEQANKEKAIADSKAKNEANSSTSSTLTSHGDMDTATTGTIVGNSRSHIYHVPGQAGYRMNSANAVYFSSEQEAINAGYRKAKR